MTQIPTPIAGDPATRYRAQPRPVSQTVVGFEDAEAQAVAKLARPLWAFRAGPYTRPDPVINTRGALLIGDALREAGHVLVIPHLTHLWHLISPHDYEFWLDYDRQLLLRCDLMIRFPGKSSGADREEIDAGRARIPVLHLECVDRRSGM